MNKRKDVFEELLGIIRYLSPPKSEEQYFIAKWRKKWAEAEGIDRMFEELQLRQDGVIRINPQDMQDEQHDGWSGSAKEGDNA